MDPNQQGKGRGRGRARARPTESGRTEKKPETASRPGTSAWGAPAGAGAAPGAGSFSQQQQMAGTSGAGAAGAATVVPAWGIRPPAPTALQAEGRGTRKRAAGDAADIQGVASEPRKGRLDPQTPQSSEHRGGGNGGVRGRTNRNEMVRTRPVDLRTKKGSAGVGIRLRANYFPLLGSTKWGLNQYRVDFSEAIDDIRLKKRLVATGIKQFKPSGYLFDGTVLYTPNRFHVDPLEFVVQEAEQNINIIIRFVGEVSSADSHYLQIFNIMIRKCFAFMKFQLMGRNYYDPQLKIELRDHNLQLWPGFVTSMRQYESNIMLNCDLSFKVLRTDTVYQILTDCGRNNNPRNEFQQSVIGTVVMTHYNNKTYRIDDVEFDSNPESSFQKRDGSSITYKEYFEQRYHVRINDMRQPLLVSRSKPREIRAGMPEVVKLIPELCVMTGLSDRQRENFQLMRAMADHTRINAGDRVTKLIQFARRLRECPEAIEEVKRWDLKLAESLVEFDGRHLPEENLIIGGARQITGGPEADWTRHLRSAAMFSTVNIDKLAIIVPSDTARAANDFNQMLSRVGQGMQMRIRGQIFEIPNDRPQSYLAKIEEVLTKSQPQMVMTVLKNNSSDRYNAIKKKCYVDRSIPCQVMVARNLTSKGAMSIATKVAIQMNCKVGGAPWGTAMPKLTMVCGYDVCRDTANRSKSFAGMVASIDHACSRYYSHTVEHENEQELSSSFAAFLIMACKEFQQVNNNNYPDRIVIYRDGVGDGQIVYVKDIEVELIKSKLQAEIYTTKKLQMAFIIVSKRINTKIFRAQPDKARRDFNPPPGTVVDDVITWPERYDFYLISQCVRQGTVAPTSYNVIEDTLGIDADKIQRFTYKMCHLYFNWSGTVRVPAPCQYAHKLAFLTAQSLHRSANAALSRTLYYL